MKIITIKRYDIICDIVMNQKRLIEKKEAEIYYDLYLNGKVDGRYNLDSLTKRIQEVLIDV